MPMKPNRRPKNRNRSRKKNLNRSPPPPPRQLRKNPNLKIRESDITNSAATSLRDAVFVCLEGD